MSVTLLFADFKQCAKLCYSLTLTDRFLLQLPLPAHFQVVSGFSIFFWRWIPSIPEEHKTLIFAVTLSSQVLLDELNWYILPHSKAELFSFRFRQDQYQMRDALSMRSRICLDLALCWHSSEMLPSHHFPLIPADSNDTYTDICEWLAQVRLDMQLFQVSLVPLPMIFDEQVSTKTT